MSRPRQPTPEVIPDPRIPVLTTQVQGLETRLEEIQSEIATLTASLEDSEDGCCPGINNNPLILCAARIHELSLLIRQLQGVDASHGAGIAGLESRIVQFDLQLDKAIRMYTSAEEQSSRANTRLGAYNESPPVIANDLLPLRSSVTSLSLAVELTRNTAIIAALETARLRTSFNVADESLRQLWALTYDVASESSTGAVAGIHVVGANSGGEQEPLEVARNLIVSFDRSLTPMKVPSPLHHCLQGGYATYYL